MRCVKCTTRLHQSYKRPQLLCVQPFLLFSNTSKYFFARSNDAPIRSPGGNMNVNRSKSTHVPPPVPFSRPQIPRVFVHHTSQDTPRLRLGSFQSCMGMCGRLCTARLLLPLNRGSNTQHVDRHLRNVIITHMTVSKKRKRLRGWIRSTKPRSVAERAQ